MVDSLAINDWLWPVCAGIIGIILGSIILIHCSTHKTVSLPEDEARIIETVASKLIAELDTWIETLKAENRAPTAEEYGRYKAKYEMVLAAIEVIKSRIDTGLNYKELFNLAKGLLGMF
jgi:hypothetical protein